jgi:hypothetical protein
MLRSECRENQVYDITRSDYMKMLNIQIGNKSYETVKQLKNWGTALTIQNFIREEIKIWAQEGRGNRGVEKTT